MKTIDEIFPLIHTYRELREARFSDATIQSLVYRGELARIRRGVYVYPSQVAELKKWEHPLLHVVGYFKSVPRTVFSHQSAAMLNSLSLISLPQRIHVYCRPNSRGSTPGIVKHVKLKPTTETRLTRCGAVTTDIATTVIDCCCVLSFREAVVLADSALRMQLIEIETLRTKMLEYQGHHRKAVARVARSMSNKSESPGGDPYPLAS